ncbi:MAG: tripartite tricarboxylate transporter substrate binding protein [Rhizobiales bacterium]|nr:tripartite tricarboxylate transporter substrate binding protein [Hyphomicrobiales bacterium]
MQRIDRRTLSLLGLAAMLPPRFAWAVDAYPSRPVHVIVGFTPGAAADITARVLGESMGPILGQQIVVENKPGAGSSIAAAYVGHETKDGYTLFLATLSIIVNQIINPNLSLDLVRDLAPISLLASVPVILVVNPDSDVRSVADLISLAKSKPDQVLHATVVGSLPHLASELFAQRAGIRWTQVPFQGSPQTVTDVIAGRSLATFSPASTVLGQIAAGKLRPLASATHKRARALPDVPTLEEEGMADFDTSLWFGLLGPAGTPRPIIEKLADAAPKAMQTPKAQEALRKQGFEPLNGGPDEFAQYIRRETARWTDVAQAAGLRS